MKIRLEGTVEEIDAAAEKLRQIFRVESVSKPYKNRNSDLHRVYIDAEELAEFDDLIDPGTGIKLTPSPGGRECLGNGEWPGYEICCDECDHFFTCFPDWKMSD